MAGKLWRKIWTVLNTDIELSLTGTVSGGVEAGKAVLELAKALNENKNAQELKPFIENIDSLLDVLNSPLDNQLQSWIEALKAGENPFTPEVLEALREEEK